MSCALPSGFAFRNNQLIRVGIKFERESSRLQSKNRLEFWNFTKILSGCSGQDGRASGEADPARGPCLGDPCSREMIRERSEIAVCFSVPRGPKELHYRHAFVWNTRERALQQWIWQIRCSYFHGFVHAVHQYSAPQSADCYLQVSLFFLRMSWTWDGITLFKASGVDLKEEL